MPRFSVAVFLPSLIASTAVVAIMPASVASADPAPPAVPPPATVSAPAPDDGAGKTTGYFRVDTDGLGTQLWFGATHDLGSVAVASDIYVVGSIGEFDIGPALAFGDVALTPMMGIAFDFAAREAVSLVPQLYTIVNTDPLYFESWIQVFLNSPLTDEAPDVFYTRDFLLYELGDTLAVGAQAELSYTMNDSPGVFESGVSSLPVGGRINLAYGENNTLGLFLGYDTQAPDDAGALTGRFTFIRLW
ncbi:MAG TPA: hypothetical protein VFG83_12175 [Kofleriaceae bacterium]|nr:hypothetical protein [Kofleriaceae bacterium]